MKIRTILILTLSLIMAIAVVACSSTTPTPAPTQPPQVITVIVTATLPPPTATSEAPSITPLPTVNAATTVQAAATQAKPTAVVATKAPVATKKPAPPAASATPSPPPLTLPAPVLVRPNFNPDTGQKDEFTSPSSALPLEWQSIKPLAANVCYMVRLDFLPTNNQPGKGDAFLQCDPSETQKAQSQTVRLTLQRPGYSGLNYSGLLPDPPTDLWVYWYVTVVADQGPGAGPSDPVTGTRHKVVPLSPKSDTFKFLLKGGGQ